MRVGHIELFVHDLAASRRFYREVLGAEDQQPQVEHVAWMRLGETELLLRPAPSIRQGAAAYGARGPALVLYTRDLDATLQRLRDRGLEIRGADGSPRCPIFTDPDGHWFQVVDPVEQ